ncbi:MAG: VanZ family protein [Lachnospiraceae bacterium]
MKKIINFLQRNAGTLFFLIYIAIVLRITVFRTGFSLTGLWQNGEINLKLFEEYIPIIQSGRWFTFFYLFVGNIIWFVPFGMVLEHKKKGKHSIRILLSGMIFSLLIETLQYAFGTGYSELDDVILNTLGTGIGILLMKAWNRIVHDAKK